MSTSWQENLDLVIDSGEDDSSVIVAGQMQGAAAVGIISPVGLDAETFKIEVNTKKDGTGAWAVLTDRDGNDAVVPTASRAMWYPELPTYPAFRIVCTTGVTAAERRFRVCLANTLI